VRAGGLFSGVGNPVPFGLTCPLPPEVEGHSELRERVQACHVSSRFTLPTLCLHIPAHWTPPCAEFHLEEFGKSWAQCSHDFERFGFQQGLTGSPPSKP